MTPDYTALFPLERIQQFPELPVTAAEARAMQAEVRRMQTVIDNLRVIASRPWTDHAADAALQSAGHSIPEGTNL